MYGRVCVLQLHEFVLTFYQLLLFKSQVQDCRIKPVVMCCVFVHFLTEFCYGFLLINALKAKGHFCRII